MMLQAQDSHSGFVEEIIHALKEALGEPYASIACVVLVVAVYLAPLVASAWQSRTMKRALSALDKELKQVNRIDRELNVAARKCAVVVNKLLAVRVLDGMITNEQALALGQLGLLRNKADISSRLLSESTASLLCNIVLKGDRNDEQLRDRFESNVQAQLQPVLNETRVIWAKFPLTHQKGGMKTLSDFFQRVGNEIAKKGVNEMFANLVAEGATVSVTVVQNHMAETVEKWFQAAQDKLIEEFAN